MRWLFLLLLVLNLVYVAWELNRDRPQHAARIALPDGVDTIVLLSELETGPTEATAVAQTDDTGLNRPDAAGTRAGGETAMQRPQAVSPEPRLPEAPLSTMAASAQDARQPAMAADAQPRAAAAEAAAMPGADRCYTLGPFSEMKKLRQVTREIRNYVVEASFRSKEEQEQTMFRVLISPLGSKEEARAMIKQLDSKNIRDHFIITEGDYRNAISLGYFSSKDRAYRYADRVRKLGFDAMAEPVFRSYTIYWLDYRISADNEIPQRILDEYLENAAQRLSRSCG